MRLLVLLLVLAAPAAAQQQVPPAMAGIAACAQGVDIEAITGRMEAFAQERGIEARVAELCAAGDRDGALAYADATKAELGATDPEAGAMLACLEDVMTTIGVEPHPCDF
jgi:streptogramin lyase